MPPSNCADPAVKGCDAGEEVPPGLHQRLEDRHAFPGDRQFASDDLLGPPLEPADMAAEHDARPVFSSPLISVSSLTRMPTSASRAVRIARLKQASWRLISAALNHPVRTIQARPRASMQIIITCCTDSSLQSQTATGPVSMPTRSRACGSFRLPIGNRIRAGRHLRLSDLRPILTHHADCRLLLRHVQRCNHSHRILHAQAPAKRRCDRSRPATEKATDAAWRLS